MAQKGFNQGRLKIPRNQRNQLGLFGLDIGGTLAKVAYTAPNNKDSDECVVHLKTYCLEDLHSCLDFVNDQVFGENSTGRTIDANGTGVSCSKFKKVIEDRLHVRLNVDQNEVLHMVRGADLIWGHLPQEQLVYPESDVAGLNFKTSFYQSGALPCLFVNMGSGLVIARVDSKDNVNVVSGGTMGGLTFLSMGLLLTKCTTFDELLTLAMKGDRRNVDLLIKDSAGTDYGPAIGDMVVTNFGKIAKLKMHDPEVTFKEEDIAASLISLIVEEMVATAYLTAECEKVHTLFFSGSFLSGRPEIMAMVKAKLQMCTFHRKHNIRAVFLQNESYLGAIGVLRNAQDNTSAIYINGAKNDVDNTKL